MGKFPKKMGKLQKREKIGKKKWKNTFINKISSKQEINNKYNEMINDLIPFNNEKNITNISTKEQPPPKNQKNPIKHKAERSQLILFGCGWLDWFCVSFK